MKTELAKIENFTAIEDIKEKLRSNMDEIRTEVRKCSDDLSQERERIDEEKMTRLEIEGELRAGSNSNFALNSVLHLRRMLRHNTHYFQTRITHYYSSLNISFSFEFDLY